MGEGCESGREGVGAWLLALAMACVPQRQRLWCALGVQVPQRHPARLAGRLVGVAPRLRHKKVGHLLGHLRRQWGGVVVGCVCMRACVCVGGGARATRAADKGGQGLRRLVGARGWWPSERRQQRELLPRCPAQEPCSAPPCPPL